MTDTPHGAEERTEAASPSPADQTTPSPEPASPKLPPITSVTDLKLVLVRVQLTSVICITEQAEQLPRPPSSMGAPEQEGGVLTQEGKLLPGSRSASGFRSEISWTLDFPGSQRKPISITGKNVAVFSTSSLASEDDAEYYSQVNAIILVHPYLRQIVDDLSSKCLGYSIMVQTLDVPDFVKAKGVQFRKERERRAAEQAAEGE